MIIDDNTPEWHASQARHLLDQIGKISAGPQGITSDAAATCALTHAVLAIEARLREGTPIGRQM
jgi:hypothetical protein